MLAQKRKGMTNDKNMGAMMTVKEVAQLLSIHVNTVRRWSNRGIIKSYRITSRGDRRFRREDIARFLAEFNEFNAVKASEWNLTRSASKILDEIVNEV
jgi:excisionase family DNA binding protein